jgi:iron complex transport system permease protein
MRNSLFILLSLFIGSVMVYLGLSIQQSTHFSLWELSPQEHQILYAIRLPRIITALIVGGSLALSGYLMQNLTQNPLAEPYLLGTAGGASLGANLVISGVFSLTFVNTFSIAIGAIIVASITTVFLLTISYDRGKLNVFKLLLGGVAMTSLAGALNAVLTYLVNDQQKVTEIVFWSMGSLSRTNSHSILLIATILCISMILTLVFKKELSLLLLGQEKASQLGLKTESFKWGIVAVSTVLTAVSVAFTGPIGFIGLFVPHFIRLVFGVNGALNIIFVVVSGGVFLLMCDVLSKIIYPPIGLPIGIVTSLIGIPFFIFLISKSKYKF